MNAQTTLRFLKDTMSEEKIIYGRKITLVPELSKEQIYWSGDDSGYETVDVNLLDGHRKMDKMLYETIYQIGEGARGMITGDLHLPFTIKQFDDFICVLKDNFARLSDEVINYIQVNAFMLPRKEFCVSFPCRDLYRPLYDIYGSDIPVPQRHYEGIIRYDIHEANDFSHPGCFSEKYLETMLSDCQNDRIYHRRRPLVEKHLRAVGLL